MTSSLLSNGCWSEMLDKGLPLSIYIFSKRIKHTHTHTHIHAADKVETLLPFWSLVER
jgi:hypothetical protein